jgi:hypothetical protein
MKTMLITVFDIKGTVHFEFISQGRRVSKAYYVEKLNQVHEAVCRKRPELLPNDWILVHDNYHAHRAPSVEQFLAQSLITEMEHPQFSCE